MADIRSPIFLRGLIAGVSTLFCASAAHAQAWSPQRNVEIVVGFVAGGGMDRTGRSIERILVANKLVPTSISVVNKPGAGSSIAYTYVSQRPGDGHTLMVVGASLLTNHIMGSSPLNHTDFALIALLFNDYPVFAVNSASPIQTGRDVVARLKTDPKSVAIGYAAAGGNHLTAVLLHRAIGGKGADLKGVGFKGAAEAIISLLGGHIDLTATSAGAAAPHIAAGRLHAVAVAAPKRLGGVLAGVPTWREQGVEVEFSLWRMIIGPKGMTPAQIAYWENALRKMTETAEWKAEIEQNFWSDNFVPGAQLRESVVQDYAVLKLLLVDIGLARGQ